MSSTTPIKALILSGGGARGAYEAGVASALLQQETFDIVCGTSIGALNGLAVAQGMGDRLPELWQTIARRDVTRLRPEVDILVRLWNELRAIAKEPARAKAGHLMHALSSLPHLKEASHLSQLRGLLDSEHVRSVIAEVADLSAVKTTFIVSVTNLSTARGDAFAFFPQGEADERAPFFFAEHDAHEITAKNYVDAVCASAALPPAFEPIVISCADGVDRVFADGGFTNNAPIRQAIDAGATEVTAIFVDPTATAGAQHAVDSIAHAASLLLEANTARMLELDLKLARRINEDVRLGVAPDKHYVHIRTIGPDEPITLPVLNFKDFSEIEKLMERGRRDGERFVRGA
ncbi:MAG: patatin-like phospholipase family protein [Candidatus Eremiobacteraeota bacterium]|nr:patatin-like phospholipase family protein [Candidatus Eremiobacteraeota bacterium]